MSVYDKERYLLFKRLHVCVDCQKKDALTMAGHICCTECAEKRSKQKAHRYGTNPAYRQKLLENKKQKEQYRREHHLCTQCGKPLPESCGYLTCFGCRAKRRERDRIKRREAGVIPFDALGEGGMCCRCGREPALPGKKLGQKCYDSNIRYLKERQQRKAELKKGGDAT